MNQKLKEILELSKNLNIVINTPNKVNCDLKNIPVFSMQGLWNVYKNVILYTSFTDYYWLENLQTNHKSVFYVYDLDWHITGLSYKSVLKAFQYPDILLCRNKDHAIKIEEYCGRKPLIIKEIKFEEIINELYTKEN